MPLILVVDDYADLAQLFAVVLRRAGFTVVTADSGHAALRLVEEGLRPDVIVSDFLLADMDGVELVDHLRRSFTLPPILFCTGHPDALPKLALPIVGVLHKPVRPAELVAVVRAVSTIAAAGLDRAQPC